MSRKLKFFLGIPSALIIAALIVVYIIVISYDFNSLKPRITKTIMDTTGRELTIGGDIDLAIGLTPSLVLSDIRFKNAPWGSQPDMVKVSRFEVQVSLLPLLSGRIEIQRFLILEPEIFIEINSSGKSNLIFESFKKDETDNKEKKPAETSSELPSLTFQNLLIEKGQLIFQDNRSGKNITVGLDQFHADTDETDGTVNIELTGNYSNEPFRVQGTLAPLHKMIDPEQVWPLALNGEALNTKVILDGSIKDAVSLRGINIGFSIKVSDLKDISSIIGKELPPGEPLVVSGNLKDLKQKIYQVSDLRVLSAENEITGQLTADINNKIPSISANLSSQTLDLRNLIVKKDKQISNPEKTDKPNKQTKKIFPDIALDLKPLKLVNVDMDIHAKKILAHNLAANDIKSRVVIKNGAMTVKPISAKIGNGSIEGHISLNSRDNTPILETKLKISGLRLGNMLKELDISDLIEGDLDAEIDLWGEGSSVAKLIAALDGHTMAIIKNGQINNKHINLLGGDLGSGIFRLLNPAKDKKDFTEINCLVNRFDFKNGFAENTVMLVDTGLMSVVGTGKIDLRTEELDIALSPSPKKGIGALSLGLGELAKPFKLAGTLAEPTLAIDSSKAALALGKAVGGIALFGPLGIAAVLLSTDRAEEDPCQAAAEIAKTGQLPPAKKESVTKKEVPQEPVKTFKEDIHDLGDALKGLFGR